MSDGQILLMSSSIAKLTAALLAAKQEFSPVLRKQENPFFKRNGKPSKYADLTEAIDATEEALTKHGLVVSQFPVNDGDKVGVLTLVLHVSGEYIGRAFALPVAKQDAQTGTAAVTYARRTAYLAALGIAAEDDDGNTAAGKTDSSTTGQQLAVKTTVAAQPSQAPKAEIPKDLPGTKPSPKEPVSEAKSPDVSVAGSSELPTEEQLVEFRKQFKQLGDDLAAAGLKAGRGLPINRKVRAYLLTTTGKNDTPEITLAQWQAFFSNAANVKNGENGIKSLVELVNEANGGKSS